MVRNVVIAELKEGTSDDAVQALIAALTGLRTPGMLQMTVGRDLGLRSGNAGLAIVSDFVDAAAYQVYDADEEHNRIRRELVAPIVEGVQRCQFQV